LEALAVSDEDHALSLPVIIIGGGGHAKVLVDVLKLQGTKLLGYTDPSARSEPALGLPYLGTDDELRSYPPPGVRLVNGVGSVRPASNRRGVFESLKTKGYRFASVVHPSAVIASDVQLAEGVQVMAGAVIQPGSRIGTNSIVNTGAIVDHDCQIGAHVHVAPGVVLSGEVRLGEETHIGTGAAIIQGIAVGDRSLVGAGAVVVRDVPSDVTVRGVPARIIPS
jgi:sugar O-acyltransferase (sialic acid O-acetyltransferase NeuD family)